MKQIHYYDEKHGLAEAVTSGLQFAFVSEDGRQACQFVWCKDFLHDAVRAVVLKKQDIIFRFDYNPETDPPIGLDKIRLIVVNTEDKQFRDKMPACLDFLHQIEDKLGIEQTVVVECENPPAKYKLGGAWYFEGSPRWLVASPMVSMYSLFIRVGMAHIVGEGFEKTIQDILDGTRSSYLYADKSRLQYAKLGVDHVLANGDQKVFPGTLQENYPSINIGTFHNLGIASFTSGTTRAFFPKWHHL